VCMMYTLSIFRNNCAKAPALPMVPDILDTVQYRVQWKLYEVPLPVKNVFNELYVISLCSGPPCLEFWTG
jgi:hypothetical protein